MTEKKILIALLFIILETQVKAICLESFSKTNNLYDKYSYPVPDFDEDYDPIITYPILMIDKKLCSACVVKERIEDTSLKEMFHPFVNKDSEVIDITTFKFTQLIGFANPEPYNPLVPEFIPSIKALEDVGTYGSIYSACIVSTNNYIRGDDMFDKCPYAVKIQTGFNFIDKEWNFKDLDIPENSFFTEVKYQIAASSHKISPRIYNAWECDIESIHSKFKLQEHSFLVMHRYYKTLQDSKIKKEDEDKILETIRTLHNEVNIFHGDLHSRNIMQSKDKRWAIIDFGKSKNMFIEKNHINYLKQLIFDYYLLYQTLGNKHAMFLKARILQEITDILKAKEKKADEAIERLQQTGNLTLDNMKFEFTPINAKINGLKSRQDLNRKEITLIGYNADSDRFIIKHGKEKISLLREKIFNTSSIE
jgi:hypothetical protein